jgi:hypothetical protein
VLWPLFWDMVGYVREDIFTGSAAPSLAPTKRSANPSTSSGQALGRGALLSSHHADYFFSSTPNVKMFSPKTIPYSPAARRSSAENW